MSLLPIYLLGVVITVHLWFFIVFLKYFGATQLCKRKPQTPEENEYYDDHHLNYRELM